MQIFISWSGSDSRKVAELLRDWLPHIIQEMEPYVSSQDIEKGERWAENIGDSLSTIDFGIIVLTPTNINAPWVNFEAGALSKTVKSRVIPILCGMDRIDAATSPLRQFQYALSTKEDISKILASINGHCTRPLDLNRLSSAIDKWWPDFINEFNLIQFLESADARQPTETDRLLKMEAAMDTILHDINKLTREMAFQRETHDSRDQRASRTAVERAAMGMDIALNNEIRENLTLSRKNNGILRDLARRELAEKERELAKIKDEYLISRKSINRDQENG